MREETLKPVDLSTDKRDLEYVEKIEKDLDTLIKAYPGDSKKLDLRSVWEHDTPLKILMKKIDEVRATAWAFQRFPVFDLDVLALLRKQIFKFHVNHEDKELELFVPVLYWCDASYDHSSSQASWNLTDTSMGSLSGSPMSWCFSNFGRIPYNEQALSRNQELLGRNWESVRCPIPKIPIAVRSRIAKLKGSFDNIQMIFEASWGPEIKHDPFIVGMIGKNAFLIDHFDLTHFEKYIMSEFVTKRT